MLGLAVKPQDEAVAREFFQLFKVEWEYARPDGRYDALICTSSEASKGKNAPVLIIYNDDRLQGARASSGAASQPQRMLRYKTDRIPVYGDSVAFAGTAVKDLVDERTHEPVASWAEANGQKTVRIGYNLFAEVRFLLRRGQPAAFAHIPTLELHIAFLRDLLRDYEIDFVEIPPRPAGSEFIACLTHDVDHVGIRLQGFNHSVLGFLYRAVVRSVFEFCHGRKSIGDVLANWLAAFSLPLVYLGLVRDFWDRLEEYADLESGLPSTFFVVPKAGDPGCDVNNRPAPRRRGVAYKLADISDQLRRLASSHHEIAVHGIDAWRDERRAKAELTAVAETMQSAGTPISGIRMHWLYYNHEAPQKLERAGFSYDSTVGYNETVGYRAGTGQAYRPLEAQELLELPLHVMDTAMLFPDYLNLSPKDAKSRVDTLIANARRFGGVVTINWHDRSIAPERRWHRLFTEIVNQLKKNGAWFATASDAVAWFKMRRSASFETESIRPAATSGLPGLTRVLNNGRVLQGEETSSRQMGFGSEPASGVMKEEIVA